MYKRQGKGAGTPTSAHFKLSEFKCKDGTAVPEKYYANCQKLMNLLEEILSLIHISPTMAAALWRTAF